MRLEKKLCLRKLRNLWKKMRRRRKFLLLVIGIVIILIVSLGFQDKRSSQIQHLKFCEPIDVVYTWVNGSEPDFIESAKKYNPNYDPARFDDKNELRYSLRSLELFAPWVRHIYIVTNGQIPYWLDLSNERVTIVPHEVLSPNPDILPTFSSAAIETFLHRIPKLSKRFLYLNDDIFLGAPLFPEDLYTESEGVRIYQAWMVPDCAEDCPWTYIGDGSCDHHCNIANCQFDGGDCATNDKGRITGEQEEYERMEEHDILVNEESKKVENDEQLYQKKQNGTLRKPFPLRHKNKNKYRVLKPMKKNTTHSFRDLVRQHRNLSTINELHDIVENYNKQLQAKGLNLENVHKTKVVEEQSLAATTLPPPAAAASVYDLTSSVADESTKDYFSHSLIYTNMLLNHHYGFKARNVLAHVGFLLDRDIIEKMHTKFNREVMITAGNRFRAANDLQFAFAYYSFVMSETRTANVGEIFDDFDTDRSQTWSDREIRTFLARMYPLPLDWSAVKFFEEVIGNCSRDLKSKSQQQTGNEQEDTKISYTTLVYERYEDSNLPLITRSLVVRCPLLAEALETNFGMRPVYKYYINPKRNSHSNFMMLTSNVTKVVDALDKMRLHPRKFNCINDNLEPKYTEDNELIRHLLEDFYLSFFPQRSQFELLPNFRNRFENWRDYQRWRRRKRAALAVAYIASGILILFLLRFLCIHKAKIVRRYVQCL